ncbi:hypothetical protein MRX96_058627 [Rhipicephalus microplus]
MGLFGKTPERSPKEQVREWTSKLRKEGYQLDRQIRAIQRQEEGVKRSLKEAAKKNDKEVCLILAKEVLRARKAINRIHASKAQLKLSRDEHEPSACYPSVGRLNAKKHRGYEEHAAVDQKCPK